MRTHVIVCLLATLLSWPAGHTLAHESDLEGGIVRTLLTSEELGNIPSHRLTAARVVLQPGASAGAHRHEAFVFVVMLRGRVQSQLDSGEVIEYGPGDTWSEPPGALHSLTRNPSAIEDAEFIAVFVAKEGAKLTTSGQWSE